MIGKYLLVGSLLLSGVAAQTPVAERIDCMHGCIDGLTDIAVLRDGLVLGVRANGVASYEGGVWKRIATIEDLEGNEDALIALEGDADDVYLFGRTCRIFSFDRASRETFEMWSRKDCEIKDVTRTVQGELFAAGLTVSPDNDDVSIHPLLIVLVDGVWTDFPSPSSGGISSLWMHDTSLGWAGMYSARDPIGETWISRWDGSGWHTVDFDLGNSIITDIDGTSLDNVWLVGGRDKLSAFASALVLHYDGRAVNVRTPSSLRLAIRAVRAMSASQTWIASSDGWIYERVSGDWTPRAWAYFGGVGFSTIAHQVESDTMWFAGDGAIVERHGGVYSLWGGDRFSGENDGGLKSISVDKSGPWGLAIGPGGPLLKFGTGEDFANVQIPDDTAAVAISVLDSERMIVGYDLAGDESRIGLLDDGRWYRADLPLGQRVLGVAISRSAAWALTRDRVDVRRGWVYRLDAHGVEMSLAVEDSLVNGIDSVGEVGAIVVGEAIHEYDGSSWSTSELDSGVARAVDWHNGSLVVVGTDWYAWSDGSGRVRRSARDFERRGPIWGVKCSAWNECIVVGSAGVWRLTEQSVTAVREFEGGSALGGYRAVDIVSDDRGYSAWIVASRESVFQLCVDMTLVETQVSVFLPLAIAR